MINHLILLKIQNMMDIKGGLASMVYTFFDKKTSDSEIKNKNMSNKEVAEELHKSIIRKFNERKVHSFFIDNT